MLKELWTGHATIEWQTRSSLHAHIPVAGIKIEQCCSLTWIFNSKRVEVSYIRKDTQIVETGGCRVPGVCWGSWWLCFNVWDQS